MQDQPIYFICEQELLDQPVLQDVENALIALQNSLNRIIDDFENCWVFTFDFRQQIMHSIVSLKMSAYELQCATFNEFISLLENMTIAAYQSHGGNDREFLLLLKNYVDRICLAAPSNKEKAKDTINTAMESIWKWIDIQPLHTFKEI